MEGSGSGSGESGESGESGSLSRVQGNVVS